MSVTPPGIPGPSDLSQKHDAADQLSGLRRRVAAGVVLAIVVVSALTIGGNARDLATALRRFRWWLLLPIFALTLWNYAWRFVKWQMYLDRLGVPRLGRWLGVRIYLAGFAMSITPGKVGEVVKAVYIRRETGAPTTRTAAAIAAERGSDALAMLGLAAIGATQYAYGRGFLALLALLAAAALIILRRPHLLLRPLDRFGQRRIARAVHSHATAFLAASSDLFTGPMLLRGVGLGIVSWVGECVAFFLVLIGLGVPASWTLLLTATFVLAVSSLAGGISLLPGGLGVADASVAGMLLLLVPDDAMTESAAVAATLIIRFATLWFAVLLGAVAMGSLERRRRHAAAPSATTGLRTPERAETAASIGSNGEGEAFT